MAGSGPGPQESATASSILHSLEAISVFSYLLQGPWCGAVNRLCMAQLSLLTSEPGAWISRDSCSLLSSYPAVLTFALFSRYRNQSRKQS